MSKIALEGNASGTGTLTIAAPNTSTDRTLTLPDASGTIDRLNRAGNVLQVVNATHSTQVTSTSSTYADTGITATITPTSASSKILVFVNVNGLGKDTSDTSALLRLVRNSTTILTFESGAAWTGSTGSNGVGGSSVSYSDSPATTSATTYKVQFASRSNGANVYYNLELTSGARASTITLMEIAG